VEIILLSKGNDSCFPGIALFWFRKEQDNKRLYRNMFLYSRGAVVSPLWQMGKPAEAKLLSARLLDAGPCWVWACWRGQAVSLCPAGQWPGERKGRWERGREQSSAGQGQGRRGARAETPGVKTVVVRRQHKLYAVCRE